MSDIAINTAIMPNSPPKNPIRGKAIIANKTS